MDNFKFLLYKMEEEDVSVNAVINDKTIWLTQKAMGELFGVERSTISEHLKNIYESLQIKSQAEICEL